MLATLATTIPKPAELPDVPAETILGGTLNIVFAVLGSVSLIVMTIQGIRYALSSGDEKKTTEARNGIIYALVGLAIALSAWSIVNFTINKVIRDTSDQAQLSSITNLLGDIVGLMIFITGVISIIMVFVGAAKYTLSGGDTKKADSGRNTLIYALIGLVIAIAGGPILVFVLDRLG